MHRKEWIKNTLCKKCRLETERKCSECDNQITKRDFAKNHTLCKQCRNPKPFYRGFHPSVEEKKREEEREKLAAMKARSERERQRKLVEEAAAKKAEEEAAAKKAEKEALENENESLRGEIESMKAKEEAAKAKRRVAAKKGAATRRKNAAKRKAEDEEATDKRKTEDEEAAAMRVAKAEIDKRAEEIIDYGGMEKIWEKFRHECQRGLRIDGGWSSFEEVKKDYVMLTKAVDFVLGPTEKK